MASPGGAFGPLSSSGPVSDGPPSTRPVAPRRSRAAGPGCRFRLPWWACAGPHCTSSVWHSWSPCRPACRYRPDATPSAICVSPPRAASSVGLPLVPLTRVSAPRPAASRLRVGRVSVVSPATHGRRCTWPLPPPRDCWCRPATFAGLVPARTLTRPAIRVTLPASAAACRPRCRPCARHGQCGYALSRASVSRERAMVSVATTYAAPASVGCAPWSVRLRLTPRQRQSVARRGQCGYTLRRASVSRRRAMVSAVSPYAAPASV